MRHFRLTAAAAIAAGGLAAAQAQDGFDACEVFTLAEAQKALGPRTEPEPANPKSRRPRVVPTCTWWSVKDGKPISASATFRFARSEAEAERAFDGERLKYQTKPMLISGAPAFWSAKLGTLQLLKGRTWVVIAVGGDKPSERDPDASRKVAEALVSKL